MLGLVCNTVSDTLSLAQKSLDLDRSPVTKRQVLKQSSKSFDPLGLTSPVTVRAKLLLQTLWQQKVSWDKPLSPEYQQLWQMLLHDLQHLNTIPIPRYYLKDRMSTDEPVELHMFSDASTKAYGAVGYLRQGTCTSFIIAKARVAPLKPLNASKTGANGCHNCNKNVHSDQVFNWRYGIINSVHMWSDSQIVLHWLNSDKKLKYFVSSHVKEVTNVCPAQWRSYCPSADNPADLLTRGISLPTLQASAIWTHGPEWLTYEEQRPVWSPKEMLHVQLAVAKAEVLPESVEQPAEDHTGVEMIINIDMQVQYIDKTVVCNSICTTIY